MTSLFDDVFGAGKDLYSSLRNAAAEDAAALLRSLHPTTHELSVETTDKSHHAIIRRAVGVYIAIVRHARAGGRVEFVTAAGARTTLKVRLVTKEGG